MTEHEDLENEFTMGGGEKRLIGTQDQDYNPFPDAKRLKQLKAKGEEEFYSRAIKVLESNLSTEINDLHLNLEEIEENILKVQQYLHTIRYHASLNLYAYNKIQMSSTTNKPHSKSSLNHPTLKRHLGTSSSCTEVLPTTENLSEKVQFTNNYIPKESNSEGHVKKKEYKSTNTDKADVFDPVALPEPCPTVITQRRRERFQKKMEITIGNTYRYLKESENPGSLMKFKWRAYVRAADNVTPIHNVISTVKFTLDKSYAPCNEVVIREPPFSICQRGWGEFKLFLEIKFVDPRNKPVHLIHPLTLSRQSDPLAFTGLWRLGKEQLYDIWLYDKKEQEPQIDQELMVESKKEFTEEPVTAKLKDQFKYSETIYKDEEGNITISHCEKGRQDYSQTAQELLANQKTEETDSAIPCTEMDSSLCSSLKSSEQGRCVQSSTVNLETDVSSDQSSLITDKEKPDISQDSESNNDINKILQRFHKEEHMSQIWIRQNNGKLVPCKVPKEMYNLALKHAAKKSTNKTTTVECSSEATQSSNFLNKCSHEASVVNRISNSTIHNIDTIGSNSSDTPELNKNVNSTCRTHIPNDPCTVGKISNTSSSKELISNSPPVAGLSRASSNLANGKTSIQLKPLAAAGALTSIQLKPQVQPVLPARDQTFILPASGITNFPVNGTLKLKSVKLPNRLSSQPHSKIRLQTITNTVTLPQHKPKNTENNNDIATCPSGTAPLIPVAHNSTLLPFHNLKTVPKFIVNCNNLRIRQPLPLSFRVIKREELRPLTFSVGNNKLENAKVSGKTIMLAVSSQQSGNENKNTLSNAELSSQSGGINVVHAGDITDKSKSVKENLISTPLQEQQIQTVVKTENNPTENKKESDKPTSLLKWFEERKMLLRLQSRDCLSVEEVLRIYLKGIPLDAALAAHHSRFSDVLSPVDVSELHSIGGRKIAIEFLRAREIMKELKFLDVKDWRRWNSRKVVLWARQHGYNNFCNGVPWKLGLKYEVPSKVVSEENWLLNDADEEVSGALDTKKYNHNVSLEVDIDIENVIEETTSRQEASLSEDETVILAPPLMVEENGIVDAVLSKVRNRLEPEEVVPGVKMDIAKNMLYKATMSFMEDLIRSSYAAAAADFNAAAVPSYSKDSGETSENRVEVAIEKSHVQSVLLCGRSGFKSLTRFGVGKKYSWT